MTDSDSRAAVRTEETSLFRQEIMAVTIRVKGLEIFFRGILLPHLRPVASAQYRLNDGYNGIFLYKQMESQ